MMKIFSLYDTAIQSHSTNPFFQPSSAAAVRAIKGEMQNPESMLAKHPGDFELWCLGEYDEQKGTITPNMERVARLGDLVEVKGA
ncbi:nonstructural protein [Flyfo microvirus Tbat2_130]|nr:nonstructural protein [Flyfo microvirus Tbat2_130]